MEIYSCFCDRYCLLKNFFDGESGLVKDKIYPMLLVVIARGFLKSCLIGRPKFKKGLGTSVHIVKITYYQKK